MGLAVNCAGLSYVVIGAGVIRVAFLLLLTMRRDLVLFHSPRSKDADVKAKILLKLEFPVRGQDKLKRQVNSERKQNKINIAWRCPVRLKCARTQTLLRFISLLPGNISSFFGLLTSFTIISCFCLTVL